MAIRRGLHGLSRRGRRSYKKSAGDAFLPLWELTPVGDGRWAMGVAHAINSIALPTVAYRVGSKS